MSKGLHIQNSHRQGPIPDITRGVNLGKESTAGDTAERPAALVAAVADPTEMFAEEESSLETDPESPKFSQGTSEEGLSDLEILEGSLSELSWGDHDTQKDTKTTCTAEPSSEGKGPSPMQAPEPESEKREHIRQQTQCACNLQLSKENQEQCSDLSPTCTWERAQA